MPGPRHLDVFADLAEAAGTAGRLTTDLHLAALAIENQAELHSNDTDFGRFPGLRWHNPLRSEEWRNLRPEAIIRAPQPKWRNWQTR